MSTSDVKDNESWSYEQSIRRGLVFDFVQFGSHFQLVQDLTAASKAGVPYSFKSLLATQLYSERAPDLGGVYNKFSVSTRDTDLMDFTNEKSNAAAKAPAEVFKYDYKAKPLPFTLRQAQFRGLNGKTKLEIYHTVMGKNLGSEKDEENRYFATINSNIGIFDEYYSKVDQQNNEIKLLGTSKEQIEDVASVDESIFSLNPGEWDEVDREEILTVWFDEGFFGDDSNSNFLTGVLLTDLFPAPDGGPMGEAGWVTLYIDNQILGFFVNDHPRCRSASLTCRSITAPYNSVFSQLDVCTRHDNDRILAA